MDKKKFIFINRIVASIIFITLLVLCVVTFIDLSIPTACVIFCLFALLMQLIILIEAFLLSEKTYHFGGHKIVVYAGWYNHYITFDGEKVDEHNTIVTYSPIYLSCEIDGLYLEAAISLTNRISLKINGRLYNN